MRYSLEETCRQLISERKYDVCQKELGRAMAENPHDAVPHNLMGILMERRGDHILAMKHFRAANALDPTYLPARYNMDQCGQCLVVGELAFTREDCPVTGGKKYRIEYDERHVGRLVRL